MTDAATHKSLIAAVEQYFEMMFDNDVGRFDQVFAPTAQLHGLRDGNLRILPAIEYRKLLASNPFPKSKKAPRQQEILLVDFASLSQALVKVRVRIDTILYVDYLSFHLIGGAWLVTVSTWRSALNRKRLEAARSGSNCHFTSAVSRQLPACSR